MTNFTSNFKSVSPVDLWIISRLKKENAVPLTIMATDYSRERNIKVESARKVLERRLKVLVEQGIVERLDTYPVSYKLKRLPTIFALPSRGSLRIRVPFDLSHNSHAGQTFEKSEVPLKKIQELRKLGLRVITRANAYRQRALLTAQYKASIKPKSREHADIAFLYEENIKEWNHSVLVFEDDNEQFMIRFVSTRFNTERILKRQLKKSRKALKNAFSTYRDAIMVTLTVPHIFPLVVPLKGKKGNIVGFIPLQDSIITQLKALMLAWVRKIWEGTDIKTFTAYEYHGDYVLHLHILVFGIPYLIPWERKFGRKKEDALTYYAKKYNIPLPKKKKKKTLLSKYIFTALLDVWLQKILVRFSSALQINLLEAYLRYKAKNNLQGPINEIHRIKDGNWENPPKDAVNEYSAGATYREVIGPDDYVIKYVVKMLSAIGGGGVSEEDEAKVYGYWLFGKRFNSFSRSLLRKRKKKERISYWHFIGVFNILDLPDYIRENLIEEQQEALEILEKWNKEGHRQKDRQKREHSTKKT